MEASSSGSPGETLGDLSLSTLDRLLEGFQLVGRDYRYLYLNEAAARHGRSTPAALVGRTMMEAYPEIERTEMFAVLRRALEERTPALLENAFVFPDGSTGWFELRFEPVPEGVCVLSVDITQRKRSEIALQRAARAFRMLSRSNQTLIRAVDEDQLVHSLTRWERAALACGLSCCLVLPVRGGDAAALGVLVVYGSEPDAFDEAERDVLDEVALDFGYGITALRTRRAELEAVSRLEEFRKRARAVFDHLPHATFVWEAGPDNVRLVELNEAARALLGDAVPTAMGTPATEIAPFFPGLDEDLARCLAERTAGRREVDLKVPGSEAPLRMALTCGYVPPDRVVVHAQDVTRERHTEARLLATERLEAIGRLGGGVAHDFNNLLSVILTSTEFALARLPASDPVRADVEQVQAAGQQAAQLTRQLLAFGRRQVLEPQPTDLNRVLGDLRKMLERVLGADIELALELAPDLGTVMADAGQLERVMINLTLNAREAMPRGGRLTIETSNALLDEHHGGREVAVRPGPYVCLAVTDTGVGIPAEVRDRVFEPFFSTKGGKGTGLALSSVYGIVKQSEGYIWVTSELGRGTTFRIYLPRLDAPPAERKRAESAPARSGGATVLIVEDEDGVRRASERILAAVGYRVLTAASGAEAIELALRHAGEIELVLTDVVMPGMSGPEVAARLKETRPSLEVLYMSGYADTAIGQHGVLAEGAHFIAKPFSVEALRRKVREVLDR